MVEIQKMIELCNFGKGTILPHLRYTAGILPPTLIESLDLPYHSESCPAEFSRPVACTMHVPSLGIELVTFQFTGQHSIH